MSYLRLLRQQCLKHRARVLGYCLMTNHIHLVVIPPKEDSLNLAIGRTHFLYTQHINRLHGRSGHLWQGRFHSCAMDEAYTMAAMRYIERNPVHAKMTRVPWTYRWSSAEAHASGNDNADILDMRAWEDMIDAANWKELLTQREDKETVVALRLNSQTGRPLASDSFLSKLERRLGRRLRPLPVGRPRKPEKAKPK